MKCEKDIALSLHTIADQPDFEPVPVARKAIQKELPFRLNEDQWEAIETALAAPLSIITGGPGTGKTTILRAVIQSLAQDANIGPLLGSKIKLAAPTNKAARRMSQQTGMFATSIHRLLGAIADKSKAKESRKHGAACFRPSRDRHSRVGE